MSIIDPRKMHLGKLPYRHDDRTLKLEDYLLPTLPKAPASRDWTQKASPKWGMMLNDSLGDCAVAGPAHFIQAVTANSSAEVTIPDSAILAAYKAISGYNGHPSTDTGCVLLDVLKYWRTTGIGGHKITAFVSVFPKNTAHFKAGLNLFGGVITGLQLPVSCQTQKVWAVAGGANGAVGSWGGHCTAAEKYTSAQETCITWGAAQPMTWGFVGKYMDEAWCVLTPEWIAAAGQAPNGFNLAQLQADLAAL